MAWALHDIGLFTAGWDYIGPSLRHVDELAGEYGLGEVDGVRQMVALHHKLRPCHHPWVETFRVADRVDVSRGWLRGQLTRSDVQQAVQALPYLGFHAVLLRTFMKWVAQHPLRPMPMMRW